VIEYSAYLNGGQLSETLNKEEDVVALELPKGQLVTFGLHSEVNGGEWFCDNDYVSQTFKSIGVQDKLTVYKQRNLGSRPMIQVFCVMYGGPDQSPKYGAVNAPRIMVYDSYIDNSFCGFAGIVAMSKELQVPRVPHVLTGKWYDHNTILGKIATHPKAPDTSINVSSIAQSHPSLIDTSFRIHKMIVRPVIERNDKIHGRIIGII